MKILLTADIHPTMIGGVTTSTYNLYAGLKALGHDVKVLTLSNTKRSSIKGDMHTIGSINASFIYPDVRFIFPFRRGRAVRAIKKWAPDIIHTQTEFFTFTQALGIAAAGNTPMVHTYHTMWGDSRYLNYVKGIFNEKNVAAYVRMRMKNVSTVIVPSEKTKDCLIAYGIKKPIHIIPSGIDLSLFEQGIKAEERSALRAKYGYKDDDIVLLFLGRIGKEKNINEIITYTEQLHETNKKIKLLIAGGGPYLAELQKYIEGSDAREFVRFTGPVPPEHAYKYYAAATIFTTASDSETQGITFIEAMASGLPVLCRYDPVVDNLIIDGETGRTYTGYRMFEEKINRLINDPSHYAAIQCKAKELVKIYSIESFAASAAQLYEEVLGDAEEQV